MKMSQSVYSKQYVYYGECEQHSESDLIQNLEREILRWTYSPPGLGDSQEHIKVNTTSAVDKAR